MKCFSIVINLLFPVWVAYAQLQETARYEQKIPRKMDYTFEILPFLQEKKVILFGEKEDNEEYQRRKVYYFNVLDSNLKKVAEKEYRLERKWEYYGYYTDSTHLYLIFYTDNQKQFALISYNANNDIEYRQGDLPFSISPISFVVFGNNLFMVGSYRGKDVIIDFSFFDNSVKVIPTFFDEKLDIKNISINKDEGTAHVLVRELKRGEKQFYIQYLQSNGKILDKLKLSFEKKQYPTELEPLIYQNENFLIGTYGDGQSHFYSQGWIFGKYEFGKKPYLTFNSFDNLGHYFDYIPNESRRNKEIEKVEKKRKKGKSYNYKLRVHLHKPFFWQDKIIVMAELYQTSYQYNNSIISPYPMMTTNPALLTPYERLALRSWGAYYPTPNVPIFHFVHSLVLAFDARGNLLWDNALPIKNITKSNLYPNVTIALQENQFLLLQPHEKGINLRACREREVIYENNEVPYQKNYTIVPEKENKIRPINNLIFRWFGEYILISGIYNPKADKIFTREEDVFYLAKVKFIKPEEAKK
ncbi:hypothetical protein [Raineya orbicola]|jgi:hypothetical protein|uniref:Uncharacterized protein n=1 Tax=Raineya orbicola TaxID=2016530 RepID=A0A2N3IIB9_9BACT|nr:hypothetical protein [Raineya orbicola]PKQ69973.1 hypothetical protein Rain11_1038 [Raineya orbicola]